MPRLLDLIYRYLSVMDNDKVLTVKDLKELFDKAYKEERRHNDLLDDIDLMSDLG